MQTISRQAQVFALVVVSTATIVVVAFADQILWRDWPRLLTFFCMLVVAYSVRVPDPRGVSVTPSTVLSYLAMYVFNPPTALLLAGSSRALGDIISRGWVPWRAFFNGSQIALSVGLGAYVYRLVGGVPLRIDAPLAYLAFLAAPLASQAANNFFVAYLVSQWRGTPPFITWFNGVRYLFWQNLLSIPTAIVLGVLYVRVNYAVVLAYLALLPFQWMALRLYINRRRLYEQIVDGLVVATDVNFPLGRGHARRVADLAVAIAREIRLSETAVESIQFAALLHDVGMIGKDDMLDRPMLTPEDAESLRDHVRVGAEIARELPTKEIADMILRHHEHYDGTGYPGGLREEAIPLGARIIALAEVVDSMASGTFPYATASSTESILAHIAAEGGHAFDPAVADAFQRVVERGSARLDEAQPENRGWREPPRFGELPAR